MTSRHAIAALLFIGLLPGCATWAPPMSGPPRVGVNEVRVSTLTGEQFILERPFVDASEYVGWRHSGEIRRIPMDSIAFFEVHDYSRGRTGLAILGGAALGAGLVAHEISEKGLYR